MAKNNATDESEELEVDNQLEVESQFQPHFWRPAVICGICEACGSAEYIGGEMKKTIDKSTGQTMHTPTGGYWKNCNATICPHYKPIYEKGQSIQCAGCGERFTGAMNSLGKFSEILATRLVLVFSFTKDKNKLIMFCNSFECSKKRFNRLMNG